MNIKEIIDNAPEGVTHYCKSTDVYYQVKGDVVYGFYGGLSRKDVSSFSVYEVNTDSDFVSISDLTMKSTIPSEIKDKLIKKLQLNRKRATDNIEEITSFGGETKATYHGGWGVGYYEGKVAAIEDVLDMLFEGWDE